MTAAVDLRRYWRDAALARPDTGAIAPEDTWQRPRLPRAPFTFWLTVHMPQWLARTDVPLMVSRTRFYTKTGRLRRRLPRARGPWALDSGGFTEVAKHRGWRIDSARYVADVRRLRDEVGNLCWVAPQDWMCEPDVVAGTGLSIHHHQHLTVWNWVALRWHDATLPWVPVLQGWTLDDYLRHRDHYASSGTDLTRQPLVGVGTMCRRTGSGATIAAILHRLGAEGLRCHAFGVKGDALAALYAPGPRDVGLFGEAPSAAPPPSADSAAWSMAARKFHARGLSRREQLDLFGATVVLPRGGGPIVPGHRHGRDGGGSCANCLAWALAWRDRLLARLPATREAA